MNNTIMPSKEIYFSIPDFYNLFNLNMNLLSLMELQPEYFYDNVHIDSVYGSFPGCIWNSGRATIGQATYENILATVKAFNDRGISVRYTFTNSHLEEKHLHDYYCNRILEITGNITQAINGTFVRNGINISSSLLDRYLAENYPDFYRMWSTTKPGNESVKTINELSKDRMTVIYYGMNNTTALNRLKHPEHIEVLVSETCIENCPNRQEHYQDICNLQTMQPSAGFTCPHNCERYFYYETVTKRKHYVSLEAIHEIYLPRGINHFKIGGRNDNVANVIENYVNYFVKPEHRDNVRNKLLVLQFAGGTITQTSK